MSVCPYVCVPICSLCITKSLWTYVCNLTTFLAYIFGNNTQALIEFGNIPSSGGSVIAIFVSVSLLCHVSSDFRKVYDEITLRIKPFSFLCVCIFLAVIRKYSLIWKYSVGRGADYNNNFKAIEKYVTLCLELNNFFFCFFAMQVLMNSIKIRRKVNM